MQDTEYRVQSTEYRKQTTENRIKSTAYTKCKMQNKEYKVKS